MDGPSFGGKHAERKITNSRVAGEAETERRKRRMGGLGGACDDEINNRPTRKLRKLLSTVRIDADSLLERTRRGKRTGGEGKDS